jgi:hypothetical protein
LLKLQFPLNFTGKGYNNNRLCRGGQKAIEDEEEYEKKVMSIEFNQHKEQSSLIVHAININDF